MSINDRLPRNKSLQTISKNLRRNPTKEENHLWYDYLKNSRPKFHRQSIIGNYVVDFFCPKAKLVIELDGSQHYLPANTQKDNKRTAYLESLGILVVRFTNLDIRQNFEGVCQRIKETVATRVHKTCNDTAPVIACEKH